MSQSNLPAKDSILKRIVLQGTVLLLIASFLLALAIPLGGMAGLSPIASRATAEADAPERYGITNKSGVNVRKEPGTKAGQVRQLPNTGTAVLILGDEVNSAGERWFSVRLSDGKAGYIRADLLTEINEAEYALASAPKEDKASRSAGEASTRQADAEKPSGGPMVWIPTISGKKYHTSARCSGMKGPAQVTKGEAERRGFTPCKKCY